MKYGLLRQRHPEYTGARWEELGDLYEGGYALVEKASRYMPRFVGENNERYAERLNAASYLNYIGQISDYFVANLFAQELHLTQAADADDASTPGSTPTPDGFYDEFASDADLRGTPFAKLLRCAFTSALVKGKALLALDFPTAPSAPASLADEEALGASRAYAFEVPVEQLIDWEYDDKGGFAWAILHRLVIRRATPLDSRDRVVEEFKVWLLDGEYARWELYRTRPRKTNEEIKDDEDVPLAARGATTFKCIPLLELLMPAGLWVGNKLGTLAREHFQRRSALNAAENKSLFAIPYVKLGPEISAPGDALPAEVQQDPHRGRDPRREFHTRGYVVLGKDDDIGFAEPGGAAYELVYKQLEALVDEMFRVVHQMAASISNTSTAVGRAAVSKAEDRRATETVLAAYGALVRDFAKRVYDTISAARGEDVVWTPHGLDKFELEDRDAILKEALALDAVSIPSPTFKKLYKTKLAFALVGNVPPETQDTIRDEIEQGVEHELELREMMDEALLGGEGEDEGTRAGDPHGARPPPPREEGRAPPPPRRKKNAPKPPKSGAQRRA
jgi:hypothetical protein